MTGKIPTVAIWRPQPGPQKALIDCPLPEIFYGGARGGGKTDGVLGKYVLKAGKYGNGFNGIFFRRELPMLDDAIERSKELYLPLGAQWQDQKKTWTFPNGGRLRFRPLERTADAEKYQGQNITDACVEEAGNYPDPAPIDRLNGVLRSAKGVPTQLIMTGNPGGPGQQWIKSRYIDPCPAGMTPLVRKLPNGKEFKSVFIPSKVQQNKLLMLNDPEYIDRLYLVGSEELVRAWLEGDWTAIEGAFFDCFSTERHVIRPFSIPPEWTRFRAGDWGSYRPFSIGWYAIANDNPVVYDGKETYFPKGALIKYREWYGMEEGRPNIGLKMTAEEVAEGVLEKEQGDVINFTHSVIDPSAFSEDGGPSIAERMWKKGVKWRKADNRRVSRKGAIGGWDQLRARLKGDDAPMLYFFDTCIHTIRTIPALQHDETNPEDVDTESEDHAGDETRYACMSRPFVRKIEPIVKGKTVTVGPDNTMTLDEMWEAHEKHIERRDRI